MTEPIHSRLLLGDTARAKILAGATTLADAVRGTLGPKARSILIRRRFGGPIVCDDGVTIAKELHLADPEEVVKVSARHEVNFLPPEANA